MKSSEATILVLPGLGGGTEEHWYARWQAGLRTAEWVGLDDWSEPAREAYAAAIADAVARAGRPVVLVGHGYGSLAAVHAAPQLAGGKVRGAFLAAVPDIEAAGPVHQVAASYRPLPRDPLPFPSLVLASRNDPHCAFGVAEDLAAAWGSRLVDLRGTGHVAPDSGPGPWPEGLMTFGKFLQQLSPA
ncbi:MAG: alpha/beta hydrolase [Thalassobaculaceae bacterium]|nr:alpha/beta hydrolase [Thalassobaculaceae bacterium]